MPKKMFIPGLDTIVWRELHRMQRFGRAAANAGDVYRRLRKRLRKAERFKGMWDVVSVLGSMLRFQELQT